MAASGRLRTSSPSGCYKVLQPLSPFLCSPAHPQQNGDFQTQIRTLSLNKAPTCLDVIPVDCPGSLCVHTHCFSVVCKLGRDDPPKFHGKHLKIRTGLCVVERWLSGKSVHCSCRGPEFTSGSWQPLITLSQEGPIWPQYPTCAQTHIHTHN